MSRPLPPTGSQLGDFIVQINQPVAELNLTALILEHQPTGARLLHLACDDPNNVFAVGFRTPPPDSTGVAHILEHTVLCGSRAYPVRDPFFAMLKRSLNTFMNAMTAADWTFYPVASMNRKDYDNLMGIYLDAVFFPLLREADFRQEGHRLEFDDPEDLTSLQIKGVVFNEMKGAMADPSSLLGRRLNRALYPSTCYGQNSGGEPSVIPDLTWEGLRSFHRAYYHPSNSWIYTYGDMPLEDHLEKIAKLALGRFDRQDVDSTIPLEKRFESPGRFEETFPIGADEETAGRSMVQLAWLACPIENTFERAALGILSNLLLGNPAAPLYQALLDSKLGQNLCPGTGYHDDYRDTYIAAGLQGCEPEDADAIEQLIVETLERVAENGLPQERIDAALHQYEFSHREVTGDQYPYGLTLMMRLLGPWLHVGDPLSPLQLEQNLARLKTAASDARFFPGLIRRHLLDNPHRIRLTLRPDPDHSRREERLYLERIQSASASLDEDAIAKLKADADALRQSQEAQDDTSCLPTLELTDIEPSERPTIPRESTVADQAVQWYDQPTNGIVNLAMQFEAGDLPRELQPYVPLFCALLPQIGAAGHDYLEMTKRITATTGGIRLGTNLLEDPDNLDNFSPVIDLKAKALAHNTDQLVAILHDMLTAPDFGDLDRLRTVIGQVKTAMENSIPGAGHSFASRAAASSLTSAAKLREEWSGMTQVALIGLISANDEEDLVGIAAHFQTIARWLLSRERLSIAVTSEAETQAQLQSPLQALFETLPSRPLTESADFSQGPDGRAVGWSYNVPVAYIAQVFRAVPYNHPDSASLQVLSKLLRAGYLHREIREKGGAYGGMAGFNADGGLFSMVSYRDPHLERTLDVYRQAVDWTCDGEFSDEMVKEAILAVFGELDRPLSPGGRGYREFLHRQQGLTLEMRQEHRRRALQTDRAALIRVAETYLAQGWEQSAVGIIAGDEKFEEARGRLKQLQLDVKRLS